MSYSPILLLHILAGTAGLLSGTAALCFRKGSRRHALAGRVFVISMLAMAAGAIYLAIVKHQPNNIGGGLLTLYLIGTAWLTARRRRGETSPFDWVAVLIPLAIGILGWMNGTEALRSPSGTKYDVPGGMHLFMGSVCLLAAAGDVRMLLRGGIIGAPRIARHLWRMCFGLFIAAGSFFLGPLQPPPPPAHTSRRRPASLSRHLQHHPLHRPQRPPAFSLDLLATSRPLLQSLQNQATPSRPRHSQLRST